MPATPSSRGRSTQSARERSSIGGVRELVIEISMISPMVEETGPWVGDAGRRRTCCSFSVTSCRAW
jgi:hypothetical protein